MTTLSPSSSVAVPHDPVAAGVSDSGDSMVRSGVHAAPVGVDTTTVGRELTVECHAGSNWSASQSRGKAAVSSHLIYSGDPEGKSVRMRGDTSVCVSALEGLVGRSGQMSGPLDGLQSTVVESASGNCGSLGAVSDFLFRKGGVPSVDDGSMSLQDSGGSKSPTGVGSSLVFGGSKSALVVGSQVEFGVDLLRFIITLIVGGDCRGIESSHVLSFGISQVSEEGDSVGDILVFFVVSGGVFHEPE